MASPDWLGLKPRFGFNQNILLNGGPLNYFIRSRSRLVGGHQRRSAQIRSSHRRQFKVLGGGNFPIFTVLPNFNCHATWWPWWGRFKPILSLCRSDSTCLCLGLFFSAKSIVYFAVFLLFCLFRWPLLHWEAKLLTSHDFLLPLCHYHCAFVVCRLLSGRLCSDNSRNLIAFFLFVCYQKKKKQINTKNCIAKWPTGFLFWFEWEVLRTISQHNGLEIARNYGNIASFEVFSVALIVVASLGVIHGFNGRKRFHFW